MATSAVVRHTAIAVLWLLVHSDMAWAQQGWTSLVSVSAQGGQTMPLVAVDSTGNALVAWTGYFSWVTVARYDAATGSYSLPHVMSRGEAGGLAMDQQGNALLVWRFLEQHMAARFNASTNRWETPRPIGMTGKPSSLDQVGFAANGNALTVWRDFSGFIRSMLYDAAANAWRSVTSPSVNIGYEFQLAVDPLGNAVLVWWPGSPAAIRAIRFTAASETWGNAVTLTAPGEIGNSPQVSFDGMGNATAVWARDVAPGGPYVVQAARYDALAGTWSAPRDLSAPSPRWPKPQVAASAGGDVIAVWMQAGLVKAARYTTPLDAWSPPVDVTPDAGPVDDRQMSPQVAIDDAGNATVIWQGWAGGQRGIDATRFQASTQAWQPSTRLAVAPVGDDESPSVAVSPSGTGALLWLAPKGEVSAVEAVRWEARPAAPTITGVAPAAGAVTVHLAPPATTDPTFAATTYEYSLDDGMAWTPRDPPADLSPLVIGGLTDGTTSSLRVRAVNVAGAGAASAPVNVTAGAVPGTPIGLVATSVVGHRVTLAWTASPSGAPAVTQYLVEGGIAPGEVLASIPTGSLVPAFAFDVPTGAFHVRVVALAGPVRSAPSNEIRLFVNTPPPPSAPTDLQGMVIGSQVALSWKMGRAGGAPTSLWLGVSGEFETEFPLPLSETFSHSPAPPGTHAIQLQAVNPTGLSPPSNEVRLLVDPTAPPSPPSGLLGLVNESDVTLSWTNTYVGGASTGILLDVTHSGTIWRIPLPEGETVTFRNVPPGSYSLVAYGADADEVGLPSNYLSVSVPAPCSGVPAPPTSVRVWAEETTILTRWKPPQTGPAVTGYTVHVSGSSFTTTARALSGAAAPGTYVVSVAAFNVCGAGPPSTSQVVVIR